VDTGRQSPTAYAENTFRWTSSGDALTLDPHSQNEGPTIVMNGQMYESLVTRDADLVLQPELAESWEAAPDGWTFNLRKDVTFHDGSAFTAEDVVFSFERARDEASDFKEQIKNVLEVQVIDDHTVKLMTDGPNPILPNQLTSLFMIDKTWAEANNVVKPQDLSTPSSTARSATPPRASRRSCPTKWISCSTHRCRISSVSRQPTVWVSRPSRRSAPSSSAWTRALTNCVPRA